MAESEGPPETAVAEASPVGAETGVGRALARVCEFLALIGGAAMLFVTAVTVISIAGRDLFGTPVTGDYEITEIGVGVAVFLFFPYTQITGQNIVAEFFTAHLSRRKREWLEAVHAAIFAAIAAFLCWRLFVGCIERIETAEMTMLLQIPLWWGYAVAVGALAVLAAVCLWCAAYLGFGKRRR